MKTADKPRLATPGAGKVTVRTPGGSGRTGLKRHGRPVLTGAGALSKPSIRRLARRAGVKRIGDGVYDESRTALRSWLARMVRDAAVLADYGRRFTITVADILQALKRNGITLYGYAEVQRRRRLTQRLPREALLAASQRVVARSQDSAVHRAAAPRRPAELAPAQRAPLPAESERPASEQAEREPASPEAAPAWERTGESATPDPVTPERAQEIQLSLNSYRESLARGGGASEAPMPRLLQWVASDLERKGRTPCSEHELEVVLDELEKRDAVMFVDDDAMHTRVVWFV